MTGDRAGDALCARGDRGGRALRQLHALRAADVPALAEMSRRLGVPVAGQGRQDGPDLIKTVLAPALRARALHVDGWFSTNILGNRDGEALRDRDSLDSKLGTKGSVLDSILGYHVEDHVVDIRYYRPRGDDKEAGTTSTSPASSASACRSR
jgi:myo-inositol-1-phosphate synthase